MKRTGLYFLLSSAFVLLTASAPAAEARTLSLDERVAAQTAIERVYWEHRIWPGENPGPKPPLEQVMPESAIRARVEDYAKKSSALESWWMRPITAEQLQAEINRMVRDSRDPKLLSELFHVLDDDPFLIAECLARPVLADRLLTNWSQGDPRFAGDESQWWEEKHPTLSTDFAATEAEYRQPAPNTAGCTDDTWSETASDVPEQASLVVSVWTGSEMIVMGNGDWGGRYDPSTDTWTGVSKVNIPANRGSTTAVWTGTEMIVWGGISTLTGEVVNTGARYNPSTNTWTPTGTGANVPAPRYLHTAVWTGTQMIVFGGNSGTQGLDTGGRYTPSTNSWLPTNPVGTPSARDWHTAVWTGSVMIVWGGNTGGGPIASGGRYNPSTDTWVLTSSTNVPSARYQHTAVWTGSEMIVWGGASPFTLQTGGRYNPATDTWLPTTLNAAPPALAGHSAVWTGSRMIVWKGTSGKRYVPATDTWESMTSPPYSQEGPAVWTGTEMIVWGSNTNLAPANTGLRYSPASNTWVPTGRGTQTPLNRSGHTAVWTGSEMIVWGGQNNNTKLSTGGRYDPATNAWTPTSVTNVPVARDGYTAVWTGTRMIVWGGRTDDERLNTGGRYDPFSNSWTPTSVTGAPSTRDGHTAVWTGTHMIVWGGQDLFGAQNTGGRYDPGANSWSATSTTGAATARSGHTAVWTGSQMIVWGGMSSAQPGTTLNTGARYQPSTNTWSPMAVGAGLERVHHTAVWTGSRMIVWGGDDGHSAFPSVAFQTGGRYDPTGDAWTFTSTGANTPEARTQHTAVWTGTTMIVWGGRQSIGGFRLGSGGRYDPVSDTWTVTSVPVTPGNRFLHTAVRTNTDMIVWGGDGVNKESASGGVYCALPCTPTTWYQDSDGDHYGSAISQVSCAQPSGYVVSTGDCDDSNAARNPGATEVCDGVDNDCDGQTDEGFDQDNDGFKTCTGDCDDGNFFVRPGAPQLCDAINNDCNDPNWPTVPANEFDNDHDGYRACAECNDTNANVRPNGPEICDGLNDNCNDPNWPAVPANEADADGDGFRICAGDCNDGAASIHPGATEVCNNISDDCDADVDEDAQGVDSDGDGVHNACDNCRFSPNAGQLDTDGDHVGNACDNCVFDANANQADTDADTFGNACDNCPVNANANQADADADHVGDACDNCPLDINGTQSDTDHDGIGDVCDTSDGLIWEFREDKTSVSWQAEQGPTSWNVYIGDLAILKSSGVYTQVPGSNPLAVRHCGETNLFADDLVVPASGGVSFSLVTGVTGGVEGSLGSSSTGPRPNANPCP